MYSCVGMYKKVKNFLHKKKNLASFELIFDKKRLHAKFIHESE